MNFYSLNKKSPALNFREATLQGQAPDGGLYFPEAIPLLEPAFLKNLKKLSREEIAFRVIQPYVSGSLSDSALYQIISETINFPIPLVQLNSSISVLELFHGPTLAFKDIGARFMSRCLGSFLQNLGKQVTVLVATSGDTGGAVANGFQDVPGVQVVILYPNGKVSPVQEQQLTTAGSNVKALALNGSFDDCQALVKQAFADSALNKQLQLTSANSINIARWLPQQFYYFFAHQQWSAEEPPVIAVPSGNFGNICAGLLAQASGLPVKHFIAACNANDTIPRFQTSGRFAPKPAIATLSNAMDVAIPSNFIRILELFQQQLPQLANKMSSSSCPDSETLRSLTEIYQQHHYFADPHGAIAYRALRQWIDLHPADSGYFLETAHPVKFPEALLQATQQQAPIPKSVSELLLAKGEKIPMDPDYGMLVEFLLGNTQ